MKQNKLKKSDRKTDNKMGKSLDSPPPQIMPKYPMGT